MDEKVEQVLPAQAVPSTSVPAAVPPLANVPSAPPEQVEAGELHWPSQTESIAKLIPALAKAQAKMGNAQKDASNPHFKSRYASLASVRDACRPLAEEGIAVIQHVTSGGGRIVTISTMLAFEDEYMVSHLTLKAAQDTPQAIASAVTYGRRVSLSASTGVAPEDDDGEAASSSLPGGVRHQANPPNPTPANQLPGKPKLPEPPPPTTTADGPAAVPVPVVARAPALAPSGVPPPPGKPPMKAPGS